MELETYVDKGASRRMELETYVDKRSSRRGESNVRFNTKLKRMVFYKASQELIKKKFGSFNYVLFRFDPNSKDSVWITPCSSDDVGRKRINVGKNDSTSFVSLSKGLLEKLGLEENLSEIFPISLDTSNKAVKIDLSKKTV